VTLRTAGWIAGGVALAALAAAAYLFASGDSLAAVKLLLFVFLVPCLAFMGGATVIAMRRPGWYRQPSAVFFLAAVLGGELILMPIMIYMPWAPARFPLDEMPFGLPILVWVGIPLFVGGLILGEGVTVMTDWRQGDRGRALSGLFVLTLSGLFIAAWIATASRHA